MGATTARDAWNTLKEEFQGNAKRMDALNVKGVADMMHQVHWCSWMFEMEDYDCDTESYEISAEKKQIDIWKRWAYMPGEKRVLSLRISHVKDREEALAPKKADFLRIKPYLQSIGNYLVGLKNGRVETFEAGKESAPVEPKSEAYLRSNGIYLTRLANAFPLEAGKESAPVETELGGWKRKLGGRLRRCYSKK
ncbi:uncharacterized protein LOC143886280 [Tasmannia lanceolata]|uniref:uncharacterized protein LOC143886280 n=1 Tax=Tasmannia lanceolata TaxID=3420 RepID=UPI004062D40B